MKKSLTIVFVFLYTLSILIADNNVISTFQNYQSIEEIGPGAPNNFYLWCLTNTQVRPADFDNYKSRFEILDSGNSHLFQAYPGDVCYRNDTFEPYTRIEAFDLYRFDQGSPWYEFEATYEIDTESEHKICFYQLKSHENELPQIMCHITAGKLTYQPAGLGARTIATIANKQNFKIKIRCNGDQIQFYYNDNFIYSGVPTYMQNGVQNYNRWGIYDNLVIEKYMSVLVKNIKLGRSLPVVEFTSPTADTTLFKGYSALNIKVETPPSPFNITSVELFLDGNSLGKSTTMPFDWGSSSSTESNPFLNLENGYHTLKAVAYINNSIIEEKTRTIRVISNNESFKNKIMIPGLIEAEDYDTGGEGISYHDNTSENLGGVYRNDAVDIESGGTGFVVGNTAKGEWLEYTVDVINSGNYDLSLLYSSARTGGGARVSISFPDENKSIITNKTLPLTSGWNSYNDITFGLVPVEKGTHIMRVTVADYGFNLDKITFKNLTGFETENLKSDNLKIYPNPSPNGLFNLPESLKWEIYTVNGIKITEGQGTKINLSQYRKGLYLLKAQEKTFKLIF